jgi:hypothetical protein
MNDELRRRDSGTRLRGLIRAQRDALEAHRRARDAFLRLEEAHERGDPGFAQHAELARSLHGFTERVGEVRREVLSLRRPSRGDEESYGGA